ncbi:hypothetical protein D7V94_06825 [Parablautia intestinalis]|uniref:Uncharacterized protein n=1 Tax=Parablautia intestinalis TaxID=2320100 RepID=A0A3A9AMY1_9FIRM|nr:hypothetical protein [Parablautia intestinalis]RKI92384.1 hypothetical protein D7V94_06825 [Parablautia intestinalis]
MKKNIILYGATEDAKNLYWAMKPCCHILGLSDRNIEKGKRVAEELNTVYIEPEKIKNTPCHYICVTSKPAYGNIHHDLVYKYNIKRTQIFCYDDFYHEIELSLGELNPKKVIYVIRWPYCHSGIGAILMAACGNLLDLPVHYEVYFDFINYRNVYTEETIPGSINSFEMWFQQPSGLRSEEVYQSKNVILSPVLDWSYSGLDIDKIIKNTGDMSTLKNYVQIFRKYLHPNDEFNALLQKERTKIFCNKQKVCGVVFRGTDYLLAKAYMHDIQPDLDTLIDKVKELQKEWHFQKIYLSTEDAAGQERFIKEFGDMVLFSERQLIDNYPVLPADSAIANVCFERENDGYLKGMEYLRQLYMLSECDYMISGWNSSFRIALLLSGGFEKYYAFNLGKYGVDDDSYATPWGHYVLLEEEKKKEKQRKAAQ